MVEYDAVRTDYRKGVIYLYEICGSAVNAAENLGFSKLLSLSPPAGMIDLIQTAFKISGHSNKTFILPKLELISHIMNKSTLTLTALAAVLALSVMPSCKKDDNKTKSRSEMLVGSWKLTFSGEDDNNNSVWDSDEREATDTPITVVYTFAAGGTGSVTTNSVTPTLDWAFTNNDNNLRVIISSPPPFGTDTLNTTVISMTDRNMVLKETSTVPVQFAEFQKQ